MIDIRRVPVSDVLNSKTLIAEYAAECSIPSIGEINPQTDIYAAIENGGMLQSFMVEKSGAESGFAIVLTPVLPHYGKRIATMESLFVAKESRSGGAGRKLMNLVEDYSKSVGCGGILYSAPTGSQLERLLEASKEYQRTNAVFFRKFN